MNNYWRKATLFIAAICILTTGQVFAQDKSDKCVIPPSGPWPTCATGGVVSQPSSNRMVGWWNLNEQSGGYITDSVASSGGILHNSPSRVTGKFGNGLSFDGQNDFVDIPNQTPLKFGESDFSVAMWIQSNDKVGLSVLIDNRYEMGWNVQGYTMFLQGGRLGFQLADGNGASYCSINKSSSCTNYTASKFVTDGQWNHVAVTVDRDGNGTFYVNGEVDKTFNATYRQGSVTNQSPIRLGGRTSNSTGFYQGNMDEVKLFNYALSASQIQATMNQSSTPYQPENTGGCLIPESGPWPACAKNGGGTKAETKPKSWDDCIIPESGPWPACAK